jgi:hypothetical protein
MSLEELRSVLADQADGYRRLRDTGRANRIASRQQDGEALECILAEQVTTLRELAELRRERRRIVRQLECAGDANWPPRD